MIIILIFVTVFALCLFLWQISNMVSVFFGSLYVKADRKLIYNSLKLAQLKKGEIFYDLGCGDGSSLIEAAKFGARATGFEISPYYYLWTKLRTFRDRNIKVVYKNIKEVDLSKADVVYCYLLPEFLEKLSSKFQKELKSGARLISVGFPIEFTKNSTFSTGASKVDNYQIKNHQVYIYKQSL
ncbi:MAG: methyltransferase domain-containing protein [Patescibacteria group bacterium]|nr:methyltransferase domain-containing protein [Patescibacteria group bacterium]